MSTAAERLQLYIDAEKNILGGAQDVRLEGRRVTFADLEVVRKGIQDLTRQAANEAAVAAGKNSSGIVLANFGDGCGE